MKREQDIHHSCKKLYKKATHSNDADDIVYKEKKKKKKSHVWVNKRKEVSQQIRTEGNRQKARMLRDTLSQSHNLTLQAASTKNGHSQNSHNTI